MQNSQSTLFKGVYEFEDLSGCLLAAKVPALGSVDLYRGTAIIVKPNQCAIFVYKGQIADVHMAGLHEVKTENLPILTKIANWQFGFESPLRCELIFVSGQLFTARRWGTAEPVIASIKQVGPVPIRAFGNFSVVVTDPKMFFLKLFGSRSTFSISELDEFIQSQIAELLPEVLKEFDSLDSLTQSYNQISKKLEGAVAKEISEFGLSVQKIQLLSAIPSQEIIEAMEAKAAIKLIGSQKEYLLYKAASSLGRPHESASNDPMQMMMGLMLGKGLLGADYHDKEEKVPAVLAKTVCSACATPIDSNVKFCPQCGKKV